MIKVAFELECDEGTEEPTSPQFAEQLASVLPKEWWAEHKEDSWGVITVYPLNYDGTLYQADGRFRPKDPTIELRAQLAQVNYHNKLLETANKNLIDKNDNQVQIIKDLQRRNDSQYADINEYTKKIRDQKTRIDGLETRLNEALINWGVAKDANQQQAYVIAENDAALIRLKDTILDNSIERKNVEAMVAKIIDAIQGAGFPTGWGDDSDLEYLEQLLDTYRTNTDDLAAHLDNLRTDR